MFNINKLSNLQKKLRKRIIEISFKHDISHIGSCLSAVDIISAVYEIKGKNEKFVLSNGHAGVALYSVIERHHGFNAEKIWLHHGTHPDRCNECYLDCSTGSLGQGLPIVIGLALADKMKNVFCLISDGECAEGSIWESLRIIHDLKIHNIKIIVNLNGWGGYDPVSLKSLRERFRGFGFNVVKINGHKIRTIIKKLKIKNTKPTIFFAKTSSDQFDFLTGLDAHYYKMKDIDYKLAIEKLK